MPMTLDPYALALAHSLLSSGTLRRLCAFLGSPRAAWEAPETALEHLLTQNQRRRLESARTQHDPDRLVASYVAQDIQAIGDADPAYPPLLKEIRDPPFLLFALGNLAALTHPGIAFVGTRKATDYGCQVVHALVSQLVPHNPCIVSGLADGIDTTSHEAALAHHLPTVAVFGTGIDQVYPRQNRALCERILAENGAVVSEYPMGTRGDKFTFPRRNRIIAGLTLGTVVVEGDATSGAMITAKCAIEEGRSVMAVPGSIFASGALGPHRLISEGATLVQNGEDIACTLGWQPRHKLPLPTPPVLLEAPAPTASPLSPEEATLLSVIAYEPMPLDQIATRTPTLSITQLQTHLTLLELAGRIRSLPGARFCRN